MGSGTPAFLTTGTTPTISGTMPDSILLSLIVAAAGFLQGLTGFGFVLIALPLLHFLIPLKTIIPLVCLLALCVSFVLAIQLRRHVNYKDIALLLTGTIPGVPLGVYLLKQVPAQYLSLALGALMIAFTLHQALARPVCRPLGKGCAPAAGFLSGLLSGSIGAGGPPVIIYSTLCPWDKHRSKGTLATYFLISGMVVSGTHAASGLTTAEVVHLFLISLPALAVGILGGTFAYGRISDKGARRLALYLVLALGCLMIVRNL